MEAGVDQTPGDFARAQVRVIPDPILIAGESVLRDGELVGWPDANRVRLLDRRSAGLGYVDSHAGEDGPAAVEVAGPFEAATLRRTPSTTPTASPCAIRRQPSQHPLDLSRRHLGVGKATEQTASIGSAQGAAVPVRDAITRGATTSR